MSNLTLRSLRTRVAVQLEMAANNPENSYFYTFSKEVRNNLNTFKDGIPGKENL